MPNPPDDAEQGRLLKLIATQHADSARAIRILYEHYRRPVMGYFVHRRVSVERAEDLFQELFFKVSRQSAQFSGGSAAGWIWATARNLLMDHVRAPNVEKTLDEQDWDKVADTSGEERLGHSPHTIDRCVQRQMQEFEKDHPERAWAVRQVKLEGWSIAQLAHHIGRTEGATREFISQCRKRLIEYLAPCRELLNS